MQVAVVGGDRPVLRPPVLLQERLTGVAERSVGDGLGSITRLPAHGTRPVQLKAFLQALPTEAVGAGQQYRVLKDPLTHGARQVFLKRTGRIVHFFVHTFSHGSTFKALARSAEFLLSL